MFRFLPSGIFVVVLAGCAAETRYEDMSYSERVTVANELVQKCRDQGLSDDSPQMEVCFEVEAKREIARREKVHSDRETVGLAISAGLQGYSEASERNQQQYYRRPVNCTSNRMGNYVNTSCY